MCTTVHCNRRPSSRIPARKVERTEGDANTLWCFPYHNTSACHLARHGKQLECCSRRAVVVDLFIKPYDICSTTGKSSGIDSVAMQTNFIYPRGNWKNSRAKKDKRNIYIQRETDRDTICWHVMKMFLLELMEVEQTFDYIQTINVAILYRDKYNNAKMNGSQRP